jgi:hypothetical protein
MALQRKDHENVTTPSATGAEDRHLALSPEQLGPGWRGTVPDKVSISDDLKPVYREIKACSLDEFDEHRAQLLTILLEFADREEALQAFQKVGDGLESDIPKRPDIGEGSVIYELDMRPIVVMKIFSSHSGNWVTIFTLWLFKDLDLDDGWVTRVMRAQIQLVSP